jgi:hypothetical protein
MNYQVNANKKKVAKQSSYQTKKNPKLKGLPRQRKIFYINKGDCIGE